MTSETNTESRANDTVVPTRPGKMAYALVGVVLILLGILLFAT